MNGGNNVVENYMNINPDNVNLDIKNKKNEIKLMWGSKPHNLHVKILKKKFYYSKVT